MFSNETPVRAAVRIQQDRIVAMPFDADDVPTESSFDFGPVAGVDIEKMFEHIKWVFKVPSISG